MINLPIWFGTGDLGSRGTIDENFAALDAFWEAGGRAIDTAHCYSAWLPNGDGLSETTLGDWIHSRGVAKEVVIATKAAHPLMSEYYPDRPTEYLTESLTRRDIGQSKERLRLDRFDLLYLHRDQHTVPVAEVRDFMGKLQSEGHFGKIGVSNWPGNRVAAWQQLGDDARIDYWQNQGSLPKPTWENGPEDPSVRYFTNADIELAARERVTLAPYTANAHGYLTRPNFSEGMFDSPANAERRVRAMRVSTELGIPADDIALAYLVSLPGQVQPIIGSLNPARIRDMVRAVGHRLPANACQYLNLEIDDWSAA
ncbi:MAG: aldo/keto reductase [Fimbriimonadaceae bacterium]|nr:aldo/keto reductase [Fimbriimonadaceae bacterium]